jgi:cell division protein FtsB
MPFEVMLIALVSIVGGLAYAAYEQHVKMKMRADRSSPRQTQEIEELKKRIEVLEKLVTDDKYQLQQEFDKLHKKAS